MITIKIAKEQTESMKKEQLFKYVNISNADDFCVERDQIVWNCGKNWDCYRYWIAIPNFYCTHSEEVGLMNDLKATVTSYFLSYMSNYDSVKYSEIKKISME